MKWKDKLTAVELKHLKDIGSVTLGDARENVLYQSEVDFPCWDCVRIGRKLGIEVELTAFYNRVKGAKNER